MPRAGLLVGGEPTTPTVDRQDSLSAGMLAPEVQPDTQLDTGESAKPPGASVKPPGARPL